MKQLHTIPKAIPAVFLTMLLVATQGCAGTTHESGDSGAKRESTGEYIDDTVITTRVKAAIFKEETLKSAEINVETYKGVVQLSGFVSEEADIQKAAEIARSVKGVASVKNDLRLKAR